MPKKLTKAQREAVENLKSKTEDGAPPIIMQIPATFLVDGHEVPFTLGKLKTVWDEAKDAGRVPHGMFLGRLVTDTSKNKTWTDGTVRAYTSKCLAGSKNLSYDRQLEHQKSVLGPNHEVDESMFLVMLFRYLASGKSDRLMLSDHMRLTSDKARDSAGDPLSVDSGGVVLGLYGSDRDAYSNCGVGVSLGISS